MRRFDYSFLKDLRISTGTAGMMSKIELLSFKEEERKKEKMEVFSALESIARIQSVKGSNAIEGIITTDKRLKEIVNQNSAPLNHDEKELLGYRNALDMIRNDHRSMDIIGGGVILDLHRIMMSEAEKEGGKYKTTDNLIVSTNSEGVSRVIFEPVSSKETPKSMEQLILAYIVARQESGINDLILIPCFILDFLCIHPFIDGNGRVSRLLSLLLMYNSGIDVGKYISFEGQINKYKDTYYKALNRSSQDWHTGNNDYVPFIENFIFTLFSCYRDLDKRFEVMEDKKINKGNRVEALILNNFGSISKKEIMETLPDVSRRTIEIKLSELQKEGKITKIGTYIDARYIRK
ncbi:MAG: Fic family protein [Methanomassiliicoccaceae archaeon]|nr:Fic family protein [Methanomassiliicoccaceae archaeon]